MGVNELMGWPGPMTHVQFEAWKEWFAWQAENESKAAPAEKPAKNQISSEQQWCAAAGPNLVKKKTD